MEFKQIEKKDYNILLQYYFPLKKALADLNAMMMIAWREIINLRFSIDDGIIYVIGDFEKTTWGWGPPIGNNIGIQHINKLLNILEENNSSGEAAILYVWDKYPLINELKKSPDVWKLDNQAIEYIYDTNLIANLPNKGLKGLRKKRDKFKRHYSPDVIPYSLELADDCLQVLEMWYRQKEHKVHSKYRKKFEMEYQVCNKAFKDRLPMNGVVVYVDGNAEAFSVGSLHCDNCFNCMFEKTNLTMNGLSVYVFSGLGEYCLPNFQEINTGEDWGVDYLANLKNKWHPARVQQSFILSKRGK